MARLPPALHLPLHMLPQPTETTCGPTCLQSVYRYWGSDVALEDVIGRTRALEHGGTFAVFLACDALTHGFEATIYTYNLTVFDPTWFRRRLDIAERLRAQLAVKDDPRIAHVTEGYLEFLRLGGKLRFTDLSPPLIRGMLRRRHPIITGLSSTFLYRVAREYGPTDIVDDLRGTPSGHFVVLAGYDRGERKLLVADPYGPHPYGGTRDYWIRMDRVFNAILLGIVTHDANLLVLAPRRRPEETAP
ncbi:hypothetical protein [Azoarcus olearius]|uniref:Peptidase C39-like domain-containing protein n=1 Tax=Azoarcus sp. (strain BH72) TaxID=418699 RepID=A1K6A8_AZOSB|nr:hypothetical protein [Azoarcus olearius]CAL94363.1 conserved hypothetical protein [Azoarcus olearius]